MNYSHIIQTFIWSYSRITSFEMCPYKFFLTYIRPTKKQPMFFSDYGSFIHSIIEQYLNDELTKNELVPYYLRNFRENVNGDPPSKDIFRSYFQQGLVYLQDIDFPFDQILGVEKQFDFFVGGHQMTGIIDCVAEENGSIVIIDNKSRTLKPRSKRKKPTQSDQELDSYLRQLYLYGIAVKDVFGSYPSELCFNCFRNQTLIREPFIEAKCEEAKVWVDEQIQKISENENWNPDMEYWKCRYLCDRHNECEYYQMNRG